MTIRVVQWKDKPNGTHDLFEKEIMGTQAGADFAKGRDGWLERTGKSRSLNAARRAALKNKNDTDSAR